MIIDPFQIRDKLSEIRQKREDLHVVENLRRLRDEEHQLMVKDTTFESQAHNLTVQANEVAALQPRVAALTAWRDHLVAWKTTLTARLNSMPPFIHDPRERARYDLLAQCVAKLDREAAFHGGACLELSPLGELMRAAGYVETPPDPSTNQTIGTLPWFGDLGSTIRQLNQLQEKLRDAESRLADALVDPVELAATHKAIAERENQKPMVKVTLDNRTIHQFRDGRVEDAGVGPSPVNISSGGWGERPRSSVSG